MNINLKYVYAFATLLIIELVIGLYVHDAFVRPYVGDILVILLMYTFIRGIVQKHIKFLPIYLFIFSVIIELAQYYHIVNVLHLQSSKVLSTVIGTSFDIKDIICYLICFAHT